jgi:hypothetical protein
LGFGFPSFVCFLFFSSKSILKDFKDFQVELQSSGYFSASKVGYFVIDLLNLFESIKPKGNSWGKFKSTEKYKIIGNSNKSIGKVEVSVELLFQKFHKKNFKVKQISYILFLIQKMITN